MRFLCLHGRGCNNQIFQMQTALLRREMGEAHTFEFVEGSIPAPAAPGMACLLQPGDECYAYYNEDEAGFKAALQGVLDFVAEEGPFDGVLAFSQGASLAASCLAQWAHDRNGDDLDAPRPPPFRCAIFCAAAGPVWHGRGEPKPEGLDPAVVGELIDVPTAHLLADNDPFGRDSLNLLHLCAAARRETLHHGGGHDIPKDAATTAAFVAIIRKTIGRADAGAEP